MLFAAALNPVEVFGLLKSPLFVATTANPYLDLLGIEATALRSNVGFSRKGVKELVLP